LVQVIILYNSESRSVGEGQQRKLRASEISEMAEFAE